MPRGRGSRTAATGLVGQRQQPVGVTKQHLPGWRKIKPLAFANEQRGVEIVLDLADPRGDVRLHAVQPLRGARHAALTHHGTEDAQIG